MADKEENKIALIGDFGVGKTSIFNRFKTGTFSENVEQQTRKQADCTETVTVDGKDVTVRQGGETCNYHCNLISSFTMPEFCKG